MSLSFSNIDETIIAPATPLAHSSLGVLRITGKETEYFFNNYFRPKYTPVPLESHRLVLGNVIDKEGRLIDECMGVIMRAPHSYTGQDTAELYVHGSPYIVQHVLSCFQDCGVRMALPGEFTYRAFMLGKMDLSAAESVQQLVEAKCEVASRRALSQLRGSFAGKITDFQNQIRDLVVLLEAYIDFPEEDIVPVHKENFYATIYNLKSEIEKLIYSYKQGRIQRYGLSVVILGKPNVGKSSILNQLLSQDRAIVTHIPGTTRDTIEESLDVEGLPIKFVDTAGIRQSEDPIEKDGIERAKQKVSSADLVLIVLDGSNPLTDDDYKALDIGEVGKSVAIINKNDLPAKITLEILKNRETLSISAKSTKCREILLEKIKHFFNFQEDGFEEVIVSEERHRDLLSQALSALERMEMSSLEETPLEIVAMDAREALDALGQIVGETTPDDIINDIFSKFCIGK